MQKTTTLTEQPPGHRAVVVFSGGQDSTTCLIQALQQYDAVYCLTFDYGQRHRAEIEVAKKLAGQLNVQAHNVLSVSALNELAVSSLTRDNILPENYPPTDDSPLYHGAGSALSATAANTARASQEASAGDLTKNQLPNTFVPGRNILFLTLAAIYAYQMQAQTVITGVCETDFSGYPDCRDDFVQALNQAVCLGLAHNIRFVTPLMWLNKAETWALADHWQQLALVRDATLSCYNGIIGSGCGQCAACHLRQRGLDHYLADRAAVMRTMREKTGLADQPR